MLILRQQVKFCKYNSKCRLSLHAVGIGRIFFLAFKSTLAFFAHGRDWTDHAISTKHKGSLVSPPADIYSRKTHIKIGAWPPLPQPASLRHGLNWISWTIPSGSKMSHQSIWDGAECVEFSKSTFNWADYISQQPIIPFYTTVRGAVLIKSEYARAENLVGTLGTRSYQYPATILLEEKIL